MKGRLPFNKNWQTQLENNLCVWSGLRDEAANNPEKRTHYEGCCRVVHLFFEKHFGSPQGFSDFLREEIARKLKDADMPVTPPERHNDWVISGHNMPEIIERTATLYETTYNTWIDAIANFKAYKHNRPSLDNPAVPPNMTFH